MEYKLRQQIYPTSNIIEQIFSIRGIAPENIQHYLQPNENDILNPLLLDNIEAGAKMFIKHVKNNSKVFVKIDDDADGFTSAALLLNYFNYIFPAFTQNNIQYFLANGKTHGINCEDIPEDIKLVIIPDAGSSQYEEHALLASQGIDVLVLDHHEAPRVSEHACVINNQLCNYPNKSLSGVGVVYKFCSYIDSILRTNYSENLLDLVAVGMIADVMDLRNFETKYLIDKGLSNIKNPFLKAMVDKQNFVISKHGGLDPFSVGFYIAPLINAVIRVGSLKDKQVLFESMLNFKGDTEIPSTKRGCAGQMETMAEQACRNCSNVKNHQTDIRDNNLEIVEKVIRDNNLLDNKILTICLDKNHAMNKNLTGLVANMLMSKYQRPVLLLNETELDGVPMWEGSGRGYEKSALTDFRGFLESCPQTEYSAGHSNAFGQGIRQDRLDEFIEYTNQQLKDIDFSPLYQVDYIFKGYDMAAANNIVKISNLKNIWGQGIEEPIVCAEDVRITKDRIVLLSRDKNPTLKITLPNGVELIKFKSSEDEFINLYADEGSININAIGKCSANTFNSTTTAQIIIDDYEIVGKQNYFF